MSDVLETQKRYYAARALEYDDWWYRRYFIYGSGR